MFDLYVFTFHHEGNIHRSLSLLSPEEVGEQGLPTTAVLGDINALLPAMTPDQFTPNPDFVTLLHDIVQQHAPQLPELHTQAQTQATGELPLIDQRVAAPEQLLNEDIIGWFPISRGEIKPERYKANPDYRLLSDKGPLQLPERLRDELLTAVQEQIRTPLPPSHQA